MMGTSNNFSEFKIHFPKFNWKIEPQLPWESYTGTCKNITIECDMLDSTWDTRITVDGEDFIVKCYETPLTIEKVAYLLRNDFTKELNARMSIIKKVISTVGNLI